MASRTRSEVELQDMLRRQISFLQVNSLRFDQGDTDLSTQLAVNLRTLLHHTGRSTSLPGHLGLGDTLRYVRGETEARVRAAAAAQLQMDPEILVVEVPVSELGLVAGRRESRLDRAAVGGAAARCPFDTRPHQRLVDPRRH